MVMTLHSPYEQKHAGFALGEWSMFTEHDVLEIHVYGNIWHDSLFKAAYYSIAHTPTFYPFL